MEQPSHTTIRHQIKKKSDNYRIKEPTAIQTGGRGADVEQAGPSHTCGGQKFRRDVSGVRSLRPTPSPPAQDSSASKISPHNF